MVSLVATEKNRFVFQRRKRRMPNPRYAGCVGLLLCCWAALYGKHFQNFHITTTKTKAPPENKIASLKSQNKSVLPVATSPTFTAASDNVGNDDSNDNGKRLVFQSDIDFPFQRMQQERNVIHPSNSPHQYEAPHVVFDDLKYRRVCSTIHKSILCMIVRYPFDVPIQDHTAPYPKPVADKFYDLRGGLMFVDGVALEHCQRSYPRSIDDLRVKTPSHRRYYECLEYLATQYKGIVLVLFTRKKISQTDDDWYGIVTPSQKQHKQSLTQSFFRNHLIVALGASPTTSIVNCLVSIFGRCQFHNRFLYACGGNTKKNSVYHDISIQVIRYQPDERKPNATSIEQLSRHLRHVVNATPPLLEFLQSPLQDISQHRYNNVTEANEVTLRPLTVIVEYPIAHMQTHDMMMHYPDQVRYNQERYVHLVMNITTPEGRLELQEAGFELRHLIVFDGLPQHFPTSTGAFMEHIATTRNESSFLDHAYPDWRPDYGSNCRGPIPRNSRLTQDVHMKARKLWQTALAEGWNQRRWYAPIWEFANQFWWQEIMWSTSANPRLDCLHAFKQKTGLTCLHKYFLQALIDGYYEERERLRPL